jgi:hypothetical protein
MKKNVKYLVVISFVDSSYWDEGSRCSRRNFGFDNKKEFKEFYQKVKETGRFETTGLGTSGKKQEFWADTVEVYKITEKLLSPEELEKL